MTLLTNVNKKFKPLGSNEDQLKNLISLGLKYDKRQKKQMLAASTPKPAKKEDIDEIEALAGFSLPSDFRRFMLSQNGGIPEKSTITTSESKERVLQKIYALSSNAQNLTLPYLFSIYKNRIPRGMLPFGDDPAGNLYLIKISPGDSYGSIFFWDHENEADLEEQPYFDNIHFISKTFDNFLNELHD